jgi:hypothetical protein
MINQPGNPAEALHNAFGEVTRLRRFNGNPAEFWPAFLAAAAAVAAASAAALTLRDPNKPDAWKKIGDWAGTGLTGNSHGAFVRQLVEISERCAVAGTTIQVVEGASHRDEKNFAVACRLGLSRPEEICVGAFLLLNATEAQAREVLVRLQLLADTPLSYLQSNAAQQARMDVEKFASSLDVLALVNTEKNYLGALLAFCNAIATRHQCDRVSLGWLTGGYITMQTISRTERFDKNMAAIKAMEKAMEESFDQNDEIIWPQPDGAQTVARDHETLAKEQGSGHLVSLPLRHDNEVLGVLLCERAARPFALLELQQIRLCCDQAMPRLTSLKASDNWIGARAAEAIRVKAAGLLGPEHTWPKLLAILGAIVLAILVFVPVHYRVEGNFILRSEQVSYLTGPFDSYIREVRVRPGDVVGPTNLLIRLDTEDLLLEEAATLADQNKYLREVDKARATNSLAEMRIAQALADQSKAHLEQVRHHLKQASIYPPFSGVLVEGDLREKIGAPVKQGEALVKIARLDSVYVEAEINQRDIHEIKEGRTGEIAFVTQPKLKFPIRIEKIEPAAFPKEGENIFVVRCALASKPENWWRPGMSGLCKLEAGNRTLFWILTHRTMDFLRLKLWW